MIGFEKIYKNLSDSLTSNKLHHAIVISGNKGLGKFEFAKLLTKEILLGKDSTDKLSLFHPDLKIIEKITGKKNISVDQVRTIAGFFQSTSASSNRKVIIVNAADDLNVSSSNAILKTLEEPNKDCYLILICHSTSKLLPTIKSRCQIHKADTLSFEQFKEAFYKLRPEFLPKLSEQEIKTLSILTDNSPRVAFKSGEDLTFLYNTLINSLNEKFLDESLLKKVNDKSFDFDNLLMIFDIFFGRLSKFCCNSLTDASEDERRLFDILSENKSIDDTFKTYDECKLLLSKTASLSLDKKLAVINCFNLICF